MHHIAAMRHIRLYRAIDEIARRRSIRTAAHVLSISPSALNRQLLGLEEDLGVDLFERLPRGVRLSTAGEIYLRCFRLHLSEMERSAAQIADLSGLRTGSVRVGVGPELSAFFAPRVVAEYRMAFPGISVEIATLGCDQASDMLNGFEVDFVVAANPVLDETIEIAHSETCPVVCVGDGFGRGNGQVRLSDLQERPLVSLRGDSGLRRTLDAAFAARRIRPRHAVTIDRTDVTALALTPDGALLAVGPDIDPEVAALKNMAVHPVRADDTGELSVQILKLRARNLPIAAARLIEAFARRLAR